jgi:hypothetical protein
MANVSILGGTAAQVVIPTNSAAVTAATQAAVDAVSARIAAGTDFSETYNGTGTVSEPTHEAALTLSAAVSLEVPVTSGLNAIISDASTPTAIEDEGTIPLTVVSGTGGLTFSRTASDAGAALILVTGGSNTINLGQGPATVAADGATSISALGGATSVLAGASGYAMVSVGGADTVSLAGTDTVSFSASAANALVTALDASNSVFETAAGQSAPIVQLAPGFETLGTIAGSTETVAGSVGGMLLVSAWGGRTFINPGAGNVTVFSGSGSETLFGSGDSTLPGVVAPANLALSNSGSDFVFGGQGYFHGGSGALNLLISSTIAGAATLVGGGSIDLLFSQGAGDSLRGSAGTVIMNAAGFSEPGFSVAGASGGVVLDAGSSHAFIFGSAWGTNTIVAGSGAATVFGNHGIGADGSPGRVGNVYVDGHSGGSLDILDFIAGADVVKLDGATIATTSTQSAGGTLTPGTYVSLSDGTVIGFIDRFLSPAQIIQSFQ